MEKEILENRIYSYAFYVLSFVVVVVGVFFRNVVVFAFSVVFVVLSSVYYNSGHIVNNLLLRGSRIVEMYNGYVLSPDLLSVSKFSGGEYSSVSIARLTRVGDSRGIDGNAIENAVKGANAQFEFSIRVKEVDKTRLVRDLETLRSINEIKMERVAIDKVGKANEIRRRIAAIDGEINSVRDGDKAYETEIRLKTMSHSTDKAEAESMARSNMDRISGSLASAMGLGYEAIGGEALLQAIEAF